MFIPGSVLKMFFVCVAAAAAVGNRVDKAIGHGRMTGDSSDPNWRTQKRKKGRDHVGIAWCLYNAKREREQCHG